MRRFLLLLAAVGFAGSLWLNWRHLRPAPPTPPPSAGEETPVPHLPVRMEEMDFSGTALADEAWQLGQPAAGAKIPDALPDPNRPPVPAPPQLPPVWEPDVRLDPGAGGS